MSEDRPLTAWHRGEIVPDVPLRRTPDADAVAGFIALSVDAARQLASTTRWTVRARLRPGYVRPWEQYSADLPDRDPQTLAHLDAHGLACVGARVSGGTVLVGIVEPLTTAEDPLEAQLGSLFGTELAVRDASLVCPASVAGEVVEARWEHDGEDRVAVLAIEARWPVALGDAIAIDGREVLTVRAIDGALEGGDAAWSSDASEARARRIASARELAHGRSIGPIEHGQPSEDRDRGGGQVLEPAHVRALLRAGAHRALLERFTLLADDRAGAEQLYRQILDGTRRPIPPGLPSAVRAYELDLRRLGLRARLEEDAIELRLLDDFDREHNAEPLPCPLLHPWAIDAAAKLLGLSRGTVTDTLYRKKTLDGRDAARWIDGGASAIGAALRALDLTSIAGGEGPRAELARAMRAAGTRPAQLVYESWSRGNVAADVRGRGERARAARDIIDRLRDLASWEERVAAVLRHPGATEAEKMDARDLLQRALDALVRGERDDERFALRHMPAMRCTRKATDYSGVAAATWSPELGHDVRVPASVAMAILRPFVAEALCRTGRADGVKAAMAMIASGDPAAREALEEVANGVPALVFVSGAARERRLLVRRIAIGDAPAIVIGREGWRGIGRGPHRAEIHVPIGDDARAEVSALVGADVSPGDEPPLSTGWIARAAWAADPGPVLFEAALRREVDPVTDPLTRAFLGKP